MRFCKALLITPGKSAIEIFNLLLFIIIFSAFCRDFGKQKVLMISMLLPLYKVLAFMLVLNV